MKKKYLAIILMVLVLGSSITAVASAHSTSKSLKADHAKATAVMNYEFKNRLFGDDKADASTTFTEKSGNYRVAVRLEGCDSKGNLIDYRYSSDAKKASVGPLVFSDVGSFRSRHSIDEYDSNYNYVEVQVDSIYQHE